MRLVIQRVKSASCTVDNKITGEIKKGYMVLVGLTHNDNESIVEKLANKLNKLRVFEDENGKMNLSIHDIDGSVLSISQFTLYADSSKGNRPSFTQAMEPSRAKELYLYFNDYLRSLNLTVEEGIFGADMQIELCNDGPVTIIFDSEDM